MFALIVTLLVQSTRLLADIQFDEKFIIQPFFVDKTLILRELFKDDGPDYNYISCPSKWGKTTTLQMIKSFAQIEIAKSRAHLNWTLTKAYQLFKNLKIARYPEVFERHMGRYAVIHFDLKIDIEEEEPINDDNVVRVLNGVIRKCYLEYRWIIKWTKTLIRGIRKQKPESIMDRAMHGTLDQVELRESVLFLAQLLRDFFDVKVLLLIDDFDYFSNKAFVSGRKHVDRYKKIVNMIIKKAFTYGNLYISHAVIFGSSCLNYNFSSYNYPELGHYELGNRMFLSDDRFAPFLGFTDNDVNALCLRYQCTDEERQQLRLWYNGYSTRKLNLHDEETNKLKLTDTRSFGSEQRSIYNPYSISQYFSSRSSSKKLSYKSIWPPSQDLKFAYNFLRVPEFRDKFIGLFKYDGIEMPFDRADIPKAFHQFTSMETFDDQTLELEDAENLLVGFCFDSGYLCYSEDLYYVARIPNYEIKNALFDILLEFYRKRSMPIDEIRDCFDRIIVASTWNDSAIVASQAQQVLSKTFRIINKPKYYRSLATDQVSESEPIRRVLLPKGLEFHNIIFTAALHTSSRKNNTVVNVTEIGDFRERDDILVHDRATNNALIIRFKNQTNMEKTIPVRFRRALKAKKNITRVKFLVVKIDVKQQVETLVQIFS